MDRLPKPAPFPVGTRLRYLGTRTSKQGRSADGPFVTVIEPGIVVTIDEVRPGRRGTLRHCRDEEGPMFYDDTGEPILDETRDGYNVYHVVGTDGYRAGRVIDRVDAKDWQRVESGEPAPKESNDER